MSFNGFNVCLSMVSMYVFQWFQCMSFNGFNVCLLMVSMYVLGQRDFLFLHENVTSSSMFMSTIYSINNFAEESLAWFELWTRGTHLNTATNATLMELLNYCDLFPAIRKAVLIELTLPASTCQVAPSFCTLRRVKTWLRSTIFTERLSGCAGRD